MAKKEQEKRQMDLGFLTFSVDVNNTPIFTEAGRKEWVNYGDNNMYPDYLIELLNKSSKHNSIVKRKADMIAGRGWEGDETFIMNEHGSENLNKIAYKNAYDLEVYGAYSLLVTWSKDKKSIARITYLDLSKVRIAKDVDQKDDPEMYKRQQDGIEFYYVSGDWSQVRKDKYKPELFQGFSTKYNDTATQVVYVKDYRPGVNFYTLPDYIASVDWIELDKEIANFHLNGAKNGFTPSMAISFKSGIPSKEEQNRFHRQIQEKFSGTDNASKVFITYSEGADTTPEFTTLGANDNDQRFLQLEETISQNMAIAHRIPPVVVGIQTAGKLAGNTEIIEAESLFQRNVIDQKQFMIEETYNELASINGVEKLELIKTEPLMPFILEDVVIEEQIEDALKNRENGDTPEEETKINE